MSYSYQSGPAHVMNIIMKVSDWDAGKLPVEPVAQGDCASFWLYVIPDVIKQHNTQ